GLAAPTRRNLQNDCDEDRVRLVVAERQSYLVGGLPHSFTVPARPILRILTNGPKDIGERARRPLSFRADDEAVQSISDEPRLPGWQFMPTEGIPSGTQL